MDPFKDLPVAQRAVPTQITLDALPAEPIVAPKSAVAAFPTPLKVGVARPVDLTSQASQLALMMRWEDVPTDHSRAAFRFTSPSAKGVRIALRVESLPIGSTLRFYGDQDVKAYEVPGQEVLSWIQLNSQADPASEAGRLYWSPYVQGESVTLEVIVPRDAPSDALRFSVPLLSHIAASLEKEDAMARIGEASACNIDAPCMPAATDIGRSVARMVFQGDGTNGTVLGATYLCTGTLLNDRMGTGTPWFLTAKHCVGSQVAASTLSTLWFYRSASCASSQVSSNATQIAQGAILLYTSPNVPAGQPLSGDTALLRLAGIPPAGAVFAGSSPEPLVYGESIYDIHHPRGDVQKYAQGLFTGASRCQDSSCYTPATTSANFMQVRWTLGVTEPGSSGSGAFTRYNNVPYLVGQLMGGSSSCSNPTSPDFFGRFDVAYPALAQWLGATSGVVRMPIYRLYNRQTATHFFTTSPLERDRALQKYPQFSNEGVSFYSYVAPGSAPDAVYRFYNTRTQAHFFTISASERDSALARFPWYSYEGTAWYASTAVQAQATPVYRFYNSKTGTHFYTISAAERDMVIRSYADEYGYEGVAYYAWPLP
ncbi:trypsin-like peptidase domain-containing protein [uncultured Pseudacidovorax sp.]|uniref:trypsin-like peptidase domain-containing protein n=1 Tax=uncultured Pseudacidovorax sp. TaxID=679313 RepID=UPI0025FD2669|nr:trypsin-like peptidase domain-containing protein [uncultured Pseudacidovorax sp.]